MELQAKMKKIPRYIKNTYKLYIYKMYVIPGIKLEQTIQLHVH